MKQQAPLTLRLLVSLSISSVEGESSMTCMPTAISAVRTAAICRAPAAREFELLPLWCFVIELVAHESWLSEYSAATEALQTFSKVINQHERALCRHGGAPDFAHVGVS